MCRSTKYCQDLKKNPQKLSNKLKREHYYLPTFEEIAFKTNGVKIFSIIDASKHSGKLNYLKIVQIYYV